MKKLMLLVAVMLQSVPALARDLIDGPLGAFAAARERTGGACAARRGTSAGSGSLVR
jgi:hypothetical protein